MNLAFYRKYRPKKFSDLLGQEALTAILQNAAKQSRFSHAYLFYGPRGVGKTTVARLLAKSANCLDRKFVGENGEPCNQCQICQEIDANRALDVIEIDAASNRGIDEIRDLKEKVRSAPTSYRYKIFIIDETHMLTKDAFNALLKIMEEPPEYVILILATTEFEKIIPTIVSRAQKFKLQRLPIQKIIAKLQKIVKEEKIEISEDAVELIAASAEGSLRDAESLLDQISSMVDKIGLPEAEQIIGKVGFKRVSELAEKIIKQEVGEALKIIKNCDDSGANLADLTKELVDYFKKLLAVNLDKKLISLYEQEMTKEDLSQLEKDGLAINQENCIKLIKSLIRAYSEIRYSPFPRAPLEVAIIENSHLKKIE